MPLPSGNTFLDVDLTQVDKKSPVDDDLMTSIAEDLYYLLNNLGGSGGGGVFEWKVNGPLSSLSNLLPFRRIDGAFVMQTKTLSSLAMALEIPGSSGTLECDVRKYRATNTPIIGIDYQFNASINSIARASSTFNTQAITAATPQVLTQSVSYWKSSIGINSIIYKGSSLWQYNLSGALDSDWKVGDYVKFDSCTNANNNGTFEIKKLNEDGLNSITVQNAIGVAQTSSAGNVNLMAFQYVLTNPANTQFVVGEKARFASHTSSANDGDLEIYAINQGTNNIIVKNKLGVTQGAVAGTIDCLRFVYTFLTAVGTDFLVGEKALFSSHTSSANDGNIEIKAINSGGNNVIVYNTAGVLQGSPAGNMVPNRWVYSLPTSPSSSFVVGNTVSFISTTAFQNSGIFSVVEVNRSGLNNLVVYNLSGVAQASAAGTARHTRRLIKFASDQSAIYSTLSRIGIVNAPDGSYNLANEFNVLEINRGGGANYNVVIDNSDGLEQLSPAGKVRLESRSVFSTRPTITSTQELEVATNGVLDNTEKVIASGRMLCLEILQIPSGSPENLTVHVA